MAVNTTALVITGESYGSETCARTSREIVGIEEWSTAGRTPDIPLNVLFLDAPPLGPKNTLPSDRWKGGLIEGIEGERLHFSCWFLSCYLYDGPWRVLPRLRKIFRFVR
jgi:hypothetical protein